MERFLSLPLIALILPIVFLGCEPRHAGQRSSASKPAMSNSDLETSIKVALDGDDQLRDANLSVTANAAKKEATLRGTVESDALRGKAVELAKSVQPGLVVNDNIEVKRRELTRRDASEGPGKPQSQRAIQVGDGVGQTLEDAWLHGKILARLVGNPKTPLRNIDIEVVQGAVTLKGKVNNAEEKAEAEKVAKSTEGVKSVENQLEIGST